MPANRIGAQPYGILPATAWSRMPWLTQPLDNNLLPYLQRLYLLLANIRRDLDGRFVDVSYVGKGSHHLLK